MRLEVKNGGFRYETGRRGFEPRDGAAPRWLLRNISLTCREGEILAVMGPNGSGKSTFLRCLAGLLRWSEGEMLLDGAVREGRSREGVTRGIGYVPQQHKNGAELRTEEMMLLGRMSGRHVFAQPTARDREAVEDWMRALGIRSLQGKTCGRISGGERKLVMIGRALTGDPQLLLLDEPEAGLDFANRLRILRLLRELKEKRRMAVVFSTHDPACGLETADRVLLLNGRGESRYGGAAEVLNEEALRWAYGVGFSMGCAFAGGRERTWVIPHED